MQYTLSNEEQRSTLIYVFQCLLVIWYITIFKVEKSNKKFYELLKCVLRTMIMVCSGMSGLAVNFKENIINNSVCDRFVNVAHKLGKFCCNVMKKFHQNSNR